MPLQILSPSGELRPHPDLPLDVTGELARELYCSMRRGRRVDPEAVRRARRFDQEALQLQRQGELGLWLMALGQEAAQVGSISAVRRSDHVFPSYREHAAALYRGVTPAEMLALWRGVAHSGWDGDRYRFHIYTLVLAAQLLHATGYAMGVQRDGCDEMVLAYFGDGSSSEGDASEAMNWAAVTGAPVLFFCQNNQWAISTPPTKQMRAPLHQRAAGFGLDSLLVDGNDVFAVHAATRRSADGIRAGSGPALIEAVTYRMDGHSTADDPTRYRPSSEIDLWRARDPLARVLALLERSDWVDAAFLRELDEECDDLASEVRRACLGLPEPPIGEMFGPVLAQESAELRCERETFEAYLGSFEE